jgi:uncharacterized membrane protein YbhN (UPF0104 family)
VLAAAYPQKRIPVFSLGCAYAAGMALNAYLPARGGEGAKVALARAQLPGSCLPTIAGSLTLLVVMDAVLGASLIVLLWATGVLPALPSLPGIPLAPIAAVIAGGVGLALLARRTRAVLLRFFSSAAQGCVIMRSPLLYVRSVLPLQLGAWTCRIGVVYLVLAAFGIDAGLETALLVVVLSGLSTVVPVPGGAGSQQVLATYALQGVVSTAAAVSFSISMQVGITAVNTAVGVAAAMLLARTMHPFAAARAVRARVAER